MAEVQTQTPFIRVLRFRQKMGKTGKRDPETGERVLDKDGKIVFESKLEDWCDYAPAHSPQNTQNTDRIRFLRPPENMDDDERAREKGKFMLARWAQIEPAYLAWQAGHEIPVNGTPLAVWPGVSEEQAEVLRACSIRTVEEVAALTDSQIGKIHLPNVRDMIKLARTFLANYDQAQLAEREAGQDQKIADVKAQNDALQEQLNAAMALLEEQAEKQSGGKRKQAEAA